MSLLESFLKGEQKPIPDEERTPMTCVDETSFYMIENGSLLEEKVTHTIVKMIEPHGNPVPAGWRNIPNEDDTFYNITAQSLKRFITSHGGEHPLLASWYNTWKEVQAEYKTGQGHFRGLITEPGKFQTEMLYTPFFWEVMMNGFDDGFGWDDKTNRLVSWFCLDDWKIIFPPSLIINLNNNERSFIFLWERDDGFVGTEIKTESEIAELDLPADG